MRHTHSIVAALAATALLAGAVNIVFASPPSGVTPTVLARGTYDSFKVMSNPAGPGKFKAEAKAPIDVVVRKHSYLAGGSTGKQQDESQSDKASAPSHQLRDSTFRGW